MIITLTGRAGVGKTTIAKILCTDHGFQRISFAAPFKAMLRALYVEMDVPYDEVNRRLAGGDKESPDPWLGGNTPRHAMQTLGTEWGRKCMGEDFWIQVWERAVGTSGAQRIVVDDCRFTNEAEAVRKLGGVVIGLRRCDVAPLPGGHPSEEGTEPDAWINSTEGAPNGVARLVRITADMVLARRRA